MIDACRAEIDELHRFFEAWLAGDDADFARCDGVLGPGFVLVSPNGHLVTRDTLVAQLRAAKGSRPGLSIRVENFDARPIGDDTWLATYEEWQTEAGRKRGRLSTALFRTEPEAPRGVTWLHVHETWLPS